MWPVEARLLYDLQKVCIDQERTIYALDLVEWFVSWGQQPIKRPLPNQGQVLTVKHLRSAARRLAQARLPDEAHRPFGKLLHAAVQRGEDRLRDRLRPAARLALDEVDLRPEHVPEGVARDKLIEELLDRVVERGFLLIGDLRDAIARNRLKLPDLAGPTHSSRATVLSVPIAASPARPSMASIAAAKSTCVAATAQLAGLRHPRWPVPHGRYLALPFGGAFLLLEGTGYLFEEIAGAKVHLANRYSLPLAALFLLGLLYAPRASARCVVEVLWQAWHVVRGVAYDLPRETLFLVLDLALAVDAGLPDLRFQLEGAVSQHSAVGELMGEAVGEVAFAGRAALLRTVRQVEYGAPGSLRAIG